MSAAPVTLPLAHNVEAVIEGIAYHLPSSDDTPSEVLLFGGIVAQLFANRVVMNGHTFPIPAALSGPLAINVGGLSITAQPGIFTKPSGSDSGTKGLFAALGGVLGGAKAATGSIGAFGKGALDFAAGTGGAVGGFPSIITGAVSSIDGVVSSLNGIQESFPSEQLSQPGVDVFSKAQTLGRQALNQVKSLTNVISDFSTLAPEAQQLARNKAGEIAVKGGLIDQVCLFKFLPSQMDLRNVIPRRIHAFRKRQTTGYRAITNCSLLYERAR